MPFSEKAVFLTYFWLSRAIF